MRDYEIQASAQEVIREESRRTRIKLTFDWPAPVVGPFSVKLAEPITAEMGDVVIEMYWPGSQQPVVVGEPVTLRQAMTITSVHGTATGVHL